MVKDDLAYIEHILDCIREIKEYTSGLSLKDFLVNELVQDAVIRNIEMSVYAIDFPAPRSR